MQNNEELFNNIKQLQNYEKDYLYSLKKSVDSFIYNSRNKKKFKNNDFDNAINTLKFFL